MGKSPRPRDPERKTDAVSPDAAEELPDLVIDQQFVPPRPLDEAIASVWVRADGNNPAEGYDLLINASFGKARVRLKSEDVEIDVELAIKEVHLAIQPINSTYVPFDETLNPLHDAITKEKTVKKTSHNLSVGGGADISTTGRLSANAHAKGDYQQSFAKTETSERTIEDRQWSQMSATTIRIRSPNAHLEGRPMSNVRGWRITPNKNSKPSGVIAFIKTREDFLVFDNIRPVHGRRKWKDKILELTRPENESRRRYFNVLLRHLLATELANFQNKTEATIAADAIVLMPRAESAVSVYSGPNLHELKVGAKIEKFLAVEKGHEPGALLGLGVEVARVPKELDERQATAAADLFLPSSNSPSTVLSWFELISTVKVKVKDLPTRVLRDLQSLHLVEVDTSGVLRLSAAHAAIHNTRLYFRYRLLSVPTIRVVKSLLGVDPKASADTISAAVQIELNVREHFSIGDKLASRLRRWASWSIADDQRRVKAVRMIQKAALERPATMQDDRRLDSVDKAHALARSVNAGVPLEIAAKTAGISISAARDIIRAWNALSMPHPNRQT